MRVLTRLFITAAMPLAGGVAVLSLTQATASAVSPPARSTQSWGTLQGEALHAASAYRGDGSLTVTGTPSPIIDSTATTASGPISVAQRTVVASDSSGTVVLQMSLLGGIQLVVDEISPATGFKGAALVLEPGSSSVAGAYPLRSSAPATATAAIRRHSGKAVVTDAVTHPLRHPGHEPARLTTTGGCAPNPLNPTVISSEFGPLIQGNGLIDCLQPETLGLIVSIYRGLDTHVGTNSGGSTYSTYYGVSAYDPCVHITGTHDFRTSQIWSVNGTDEGGASSTEIALHCT